MQLINYSEHEKLQKIKDKSQLCGKFLEWLKCKYNMIDKRECFENNYIPLGYSSFIDIEELLAEFYGIDLKLIEKEKLQALRYLNNC